MRTLPELYLTFLLLFFFCWCHTFYCCFNYKLCIHYYRFLAKNSLNISELLIFKYFISYTWIFYLLVCCVPCKCSVIEPRRDVKPLELVLQWAVNRCVGAGYPASTSYLSRAPNACLWYNSTCFHMSTKLPVWFKALASFLTVLCWLFLRALLSSPLHLTAARFVYCVFLLTHYIFYL